MTQPQDPTRRVLFRFLKFFLPFEERLCSQEKFEPTEYKKINKIFVQMIRDFEKLGYDHNVKLSDANDIAQKCHMPFNNHTFYTEGLVCKKCKKIFCPNHFLTKCPIDNCGGELEGEE